MRSSRTRRSASHAASDVSGAASTRAQSHHRERSSGWVAQPAARDHEAGGIGVEVGETVGRFGDECAIVACVPGNARRRSKGGRASRSSLAGGPLLGIGRMARAVSLPSGLSDAASAPKRVSLALLDAEIERWPVVDAESRRRSLPCVTSSRPGGSGSGRRSASGRSWAPAATPTTPSSSTPVPRSRWCTRAPWCTTT